MKIYIAGKITGDPDYRIKFEEAVRMVEGFGYIALNPAALPEGMSPADYMRICFAMLDVADEMWYLADAKESPGSFLEIQYCRYIKKHVRRFSEAVEEEKAWRD